MRINNPKSLVNFTRAPGVTPDASAYNLATIGQLKRAINNLDTKYSNILAGNENYGSNGLTESTHGYAWLNSEGKVDPSLMPALAITETHFIYQSELKALKNNNDVTEKEDLSYLLNIYVKNKIATENVRYQLGDIIIVKPTEASGSEDKEIPDPVYSGSYIIASAPKAENPEAPFTFAKIAYTDSNIVKINGKVPVNSIGEVHLYLKDILQEAYLYDTSITSGVTVDVKEAEGKAKELSDSVYRLVTIDEGAAGFRFGFVDNSSVDGGVIPYAKLKELQDLDAREAADYNDLTDAIADLNNLLETTSGKLHTESVTASGNLHTEIVTTSSYLYDEMESVSSFLYSELDTTSGFLYSELNTTSSLISSTFRNDVTYISGTIGDRTVLPNRQLSATIFEQTKALRQDVDNNLDLLNETRQDTNEYLRLIQNNVMDLHGKLNEKAIKIVEKEIEWTTDKLFGGKPVLTTLNESERAEYQVSSPDVTGILTWTYKYEPSQENVPGQVDPTENNSVSQERILAVFDADGNEIMVDINRKKLSNGLWGSYLSIDTEYVGGDENVGYTNSLIGTKWTLIVAKTIVNIPIEDATFAVGGTKYIVPPQADHGTDTWTDLPVESSTPDLPVVNE